MIRRYFQAGQVIRLTPYFTQHMRRFGYNVWGFRSERPECRVIEDCYADDIITIEGLGEDAGIRAYLPGCRERLYIE